MLGWTFDQHPLNQDRFNYFFIDRLTYDQVAHQIIHAILASFIPLFYGCGNLAVSALFPTLPRSTTQHSLHRH